MTWCKKTFKTHDASKVFFNMLPDACMPVLVEKAVFFWDRRANACQEDSILQVLNQIQKQRRDDDLAYAERRAA